MMHTVDARPIPQRPMNREQESFESLRLAQEQTVVAAVADGSLDASGLATNAHGFAEFMSERLRGGHAEETACHRGCSWCCYQNVAVFAPEVFRIVEFIRRQAPSEQERLATRLNLLDNVTRGMRATQRHKIPMPCAFLEQGRCSIYEVRPLACAEFTSRDELACKRGKRVGFGPLSIIHEKARMHAFNAIHSGLAAGVQKALPHADARPLELIAAVSDALGDNTTEAQWRCGERDFTRAVAR